MIYQFTIVIALFATSLSLNSMEQQQPEKKKSVRRKLGKALSHNPFSSNKKSPNKETAKTKNSLIRPSTLFKILPCLASVCEQSAIPKEVQQYIQRIHYILANQELEQSGKFFENWKKFNLPTLSYHSLDQNNLEVMKDLLTSNPHRLPAQSYKTFIKTMPLSIRIPLANQFNHAIPVESKDALYADAQLQLLIGVPQNNQPSFGIVYKPIFSPQEKKNMLPSSPTKRRQLIDTKKRQ